MYRKDSVGLEFFEQTHFEKCVDIIFDNEIGFELLKGNILSVSKENANLLERMLKEKQIEIKKIPVASINSLSPEEQTRIREKNLKNFIFPFLYSSFCGGYNG